MSDKGQPPEEEPVAPEGPKTEGEGPTIDEGSTTGGEGPAVEVQGSAVEGESAAAEDDGPTIEGAGQGAAGIAPGKAEGQPSEIHGPREDKPEDATVPVSGTGSGLPAMVGSMPGLDALEGTAERDDLIALRESLGDDLMALGRRGGDAVAIVAAARIVEVAETLKSRGFNLLASITCVDYLPAEPRYQVVYHFCAIPESVRRGNPLPTESDPFRRIRVKVPVSSDAAVVDSLTALYPTANWHERETWDLFGIEFAGHPDLRRILLPDDYDGHPLRKDHGTVYEEVAFTHNKDQVYAKKRFASE